MTSRDLPHQPLSRRTLVATAASPENLVPPNNRNQTPDGIILCLPAQWRTSAETINLQTKATAMPPKNLTSPDTMSSRDLPHQPLLRRTLGASAASPENLVPPHNQNQTPDGIILCLPAQRKTSAETISLWTKANTMPPKNLTSPSQHLDSLAVITQSNSVTFWTSCHGCRMRYEYLNIFMNQELLCHECEIPFMAIEIPTPKADVLKSFFVSVSDQCPTKFAAGSDARTAPASPGRDAQVKKGGDALHQNSITACSSGVEGMQTVKKRRYGTENSSANPYSDGDTGVPSQRNLPRRPKDLPRDDIRRMLMDKARTEIIRYLQ